MKILMTSLMLCMAQATFALEFQVEHPCDSKQNKKTTVQVETETVSSITLSTLEKLKVPFVGGVLGINKIWNTPTDLDSYEILSDRLMRSYGWCYTLDGKIPDVLMNEVDVDSSKKVLRWFYGYATYDARGSDDPTDPNHWINYCQPMDSLEDDSFICDQL